MADGTVFEGRSFGAKGTVVGEVVFSTTVVGFQEALTDPCYYGQIIAQTFPLVGNYGVNDEDFDSPKAQARGYIVREWCNTPSNFRSQGDINDFLIKQNVVGIHSIDTRALTRKIRENGVMNGVITTENVYEKKDELLAQIKEYKITDAVKALTASEIQKYSDGDVKYKVVLWDFGSRKYIKNELLKRGCEVIVVPAGTTSDEIKNISPDGIVFSDGPGDPMDNEAIIAEIKNVCAMNIPVLAIGLGHQMLAVSQGFKTEKLKYGHRGANQPVIDKTIGRTFVTSQNHGYVVLSDSIDTSVGTVSHINANDSSCEGIRYTAIKAVSVQFEPESNGGPQDTSYMFNEFIEMIEKEMQ